tara:strand:+ start:603 stop:962 length:360 start_codon:yes stop_codon:yes gene_type:complete
MAQKKLQKGSSWEVADLDGDGVITDGEMAMAKKMEELEHQRAMHENLDRQMDQQRMMAWVSMLSSIVIICILLTDFVSIIRMAPISGFLNTFLVAQATIVVGFMGSTAYVKSRNGKNGS